MIGQPLRVNMSRDLFSTFESSSDKTEGARLFRSSGGLDVTNMSSRAVASSIDQVVPKIDISVGSPVDGFADSMDAAQILKEALGGYGGPELDQVLMRAADPHYSLEPSNPELFGISKELAEIYSRVCEKGEQGFHTKDALRAQENAVAMREYADARRFGSGNLIIEKAVTWMQVMEAAVDAGHTLDSTLASWARDVAKIDYNDPDYLLISEFVSVVWVYGEEHNFLSSNWPRGQDRGYNEKMTQFSGVLMPVDEKS